MTTITATYSPDDNKIRVYSTTRFAAEDFARLKAAGFAWAPKQECFVAPMWAPAREDLARELATSGEIDDEDTTLMDRAEERADRFDGYSDNRAQDAQTARAAVSAIADHIPFGQPILVGHHSQRRAERDAQRIESGMRKVIKAFETSEYWARRAAGAIRHAQYKERPDVRARRIKTIEADRRKAERSQDEARKGAELYAKMAQLVANATDPQDATAKALRILGMLPGYESYSFPLADYPRQPPASQYEGPMSLYGAVKEGIITVQQAADIKQRAADRIAATAARWLAHYDLRLGYERALLSAQTGQTIEQITAPAPRRTSAKAALPLLNIRAASLDVRNLYSRGETITYPVREMTKAEFARISDDYKGTRVSACGQFRVRTAMVAGCQLVAVFLTDSKAHEMPAPAATPATTDEVTA